MTQRQAEEKKARDIPPGDDVCPTPKPVDEEPPLDRFCDLVLTGGVASGVVYPWAIVEIARAYRFRSIGGTSVGAMAAALAAAAEYGRRTGCKAPFEVLRRTPAALGECLADGRTRMFSLFQTNAGGERLINIWGRLGTGTSMTDMSLSGILRVVLSVYRAPGVLGAFAGYLLAWITAPLSQWLFIPIGAAMGIVLAICNDVRQGVICNHLGLCKGGTSEGPGPDGERRPGLSEWLHDGIQASAGLERKDRPLTFRDLWCAPAYPGGPRQTCNEQDSAEHRAIDLQVITTNVTHGRPYRLPNTDSRSRLFFKLKDLKDYFPQVVLDALRRDARPYAPRTDSDPKDCAVPADLLELPVADLPIVVAARLSLSCPLLISAVQLWAIDYEPKRGKRDLKPCQFTDGGVSSNFPIHLFDEAVPRWPTFGLWLDRESPYRPDERVWLPEFQGQGWGDAWNRFDPEAAGPKPLAYSRKDFKYLAGFLLGILTGGLDWNDRTTFRLPHVRNRVARLLLRPGEGGLNIAMPRDKILRMAHEYGTKAGRLFVERFADEKGEPSRAWREQRWIRMQLLFNGLRERLTNLRSSAQWASHAVPMAQAIEEAKGKSPIKDTANRNKLSPEQAESLQRLLTALQDLEVELRAAEPSFSPELEPELRLRAPI